MKLFKSLLSTILCIALILSVFSAIPIVQADTEFTTVPAVDYATYSRFNSTEQYIAGYGHNVIGVISRVSADKAKYMQSFADMQTQGFTAKSTSPYVTYRISAPADGTYTIKSRFNVGLDEGGSYGDGYFTVLSVNDEKFYKGQIITAGGTYHDEYTITLKKGINLIRVIAQTKELAGMSVWVNIHGLYIDSALTAVAKAEDMTLYASGASYYNKYSIGADNANRLGNVNILAAQQRNVNFDNIAIGDFKYTPYFAYTVDVPTDGYYDISAAFHTGVDAATGYFVVFVDGVKNKRNFIDTRISGMGDSIANLSVYMTAGTHTVSVTSALGHSTSEYHTWSDFWGITFGGGITKSATQIDPLTYESPNRLEAEYYGTCVRSDTPQQVNSGCSGLGCAGHFQYSNSVLQSKASLAEYFDKSNTTSVSFNVWAPKDGNYTIRPGYYVDKNASSYSMTVLVNDSTVYDVPFVATYTDINWNKNTASVSLKAGMNVIRLIPYTSDNISLHAGGYVNIDFLDIGDTLVGYKPNPVKLWANDSSYANYMNTGTYDGSLGNLRFPGTISQTLETLNLNTLPQVPYFSYTVYAPRDGYYDISLAFRAGYSWSSSPYYFGYAVDGNFVNAPHQRYYNSTTPANSYASNAANLSVYMKKGDHILTVTCPLPKNASDPNPAFAWATNWIDYGYITLNAGLVIAAKQEDPITNVVYEAENAYMQYYKTVTSSDPNFSNGAFAGSANYSYFPTYDEIAQGYVNNNASYLVFSIYSERNVTTQMKLRFRLGYAGGNDQAIYDAYVKKHGHHPYATLLVNGETPIKVEHPTKASWISTSAPFDVTLKKGMNTIYAFAPTADVAAEFNGLYFDYDSLIMRGEFGISQKDYYIPGDTNHSYRVDLVDILRMKRHLADSSVIANVHSANINRDGNVNADDLAILIKMILDPMSKENIKHSLVQPPLETTHLTGSGFVSVDNDYIRWSPYNWYDTGYSKMSTPGGAYFKIAFSGTSLGVQVDMSRLGITPKSTIKISAYIDGSTTQYRKSLADADCMGNVTLVSGLSSGKHTATVYLSFTSQDYDRWNGAVTNSLRLLGIKLDFGTRLYDASSLVSNKKIVIYGDSITEGVGINEGAEYAYSAVLGQTLGVEYGQCGNGWIGWSHFGSGHTDHFYILNQNKGYWRDYFEGKSRLVDRNDISKGYIDGAPDAVFITLGHNDHGSNYDEVQNKLINWMKDVRTTAPNAEIFIILPFATGSSHYADFRTKYVEGFNKYVSETSDAKAHIVDLGPEGHNIVVNGSSDGVHPEKAAANTLGKMIAEKVKAYF